VTTTSREDAQEQTGDAAEADTSREDAASGRTERRAEREASRAEDRADDAGERAERSDDTGEQIEGRAEQAAQKAYGELAGLGASGEGEAPVRGVELLGRVGLVGYGLVHVLIGAIAVHVVWRGGGQPDQQGALTGLTGSGSGVTVLAVMVVGLVAFAVWQGLAAVAGFRWTSGMTRVRKRAGAGRRRSRCSRWPWSGSGCWSPARRAVPARRAPRGSPACSPCPPGGSSSGSWASSWS
jgi:hypothetical protein